MGAILVRELVLDIRELGEVCPIASTCSLSKILQVSLWLEKKADVYHY